MVWFTTKAVGMQPGRSAKIMGFTEPAEGDFIQLRPTGSHDTLSFSPIELTLAKPERKRAGMAGSAVKTRRTLDQPKALKQPEILEQPSMSELEAPVTPNLSVVAAEAPASSAPESSAPAAKKPRQASTVKKTRAADVVLTISGSVGGEWTVDVVAAKKKALRGIQITPAAVGQAAKELHPEVAEAIESVLDAAREQHRVKVEQLRAELEAAEKALDELVG